MDGSQNMRGIRFWGMYMRELEARGWRGGETSMGRLGWSCFARESWESSNPLAGGRLQRIYQWLGGRLEVLPL